MQEFENLKFEIYKDRKTRKIKHIRYALEAYLATLARQEAEAKAKRSLFYRAWKWLNTKYI